MVQVTPEFESRVMRKRIKYLMPLLVTCMFVAFLDRINVGYASLTMNKELGLSAAAYGFGAGLFFLGYFIFEVPSNLVLEKVGARKWMTRIMITWGILAAAMAYVQGPKSFYVMRFLLGAAEAGFFPGAILLLTYWFRKKERAQASAIFLIGSYLGGAIGSPISGLIMTYLNGAMGLSGWKWLYIAEGIPALILAFAVWFHLSENPSDAKWLTSEEKDWIVNSIKEESGTDGEKKHISVWKALTSANALLLSFIYILYNIGSLGLKMWLPQIVSTLGKAHSLSTLAITLYTMMPYWVIILFAVVLSRHSDKTGERRWHITLASLVTAVGLFVTASATNFVVGILGLIVVGIGLGGTQPTFWGTTTQVLEAGEAAAAIALINSVGNLGGFIGPNVVGIAETVTGQFNAGVYVFAGCFALIALTIQIIYKINREKLQVNQIESKIHEQTIQA